MKLHELLGTKNRKEQERMVQALIHAAEAPVEVVAIVWDTRTNELNVVPVTSELPFQVIYMLLERARQLLQAHERQALMEQQPVGLPQVPLELDSDDSDNSPADEQVVESTL